MHQLIEAQQVEPMGCGHIPAWRAAERKNDSCPSKGKGEAVVEEE